MSALQNKTEESQVTESLLYFENQIIRFLQNLQSLTSGWKTKE